MTNFQQRQQDPTPKTVYQKRKKDGENDADDLKLQGINNLQLNEIHNNKTLLMHLHCFFPMY